MTPPLAAPLRANLARREVVLPGSQAWRPPMAGTEHYVLECLGNEAAPQTSIVRCAAGAQLDVATEVGGAELLVLAGMFHDNAGEHPEGTYMRHPAGMAYVAWAGPNGGVLFIKQRHFAPTDTRRVAIDTRAATWHQGLVPGLTVLPLHEHGAEHVALVRWAPSTRFQQHRHWGGEEILVLEGVFEDEHGRYPEGSWLRSPHLSEHNPFTGPAGALIYVKTGHLTAV